MTQKTAQKLKAFIRYITVAVCSAIATLLIKNPRPLNFKWLGILRVRLIGLEPTRREALDPKSSVSTNFTTSA